MSKSKTPEFVHLHVHSEYSMLDGLCGLPELVSKTKELGQTAIALTDHGNMHGALHFYNQCLKEEIKPIVGLEAYLAKNSRFDKQFKPGVDQAHLTLLATNFAGYQNLLKLSSIAHLEGFSYKPRIDHEILSQHTEGLILLTGCPQSLINRALREENLEEATRLVKFYQELFPGRVYIELQAHPSLEFLKELTAKQISLARDNNLPLVATNDVHYLEPSDAEAQDALICVQTRKLLADTDRMTMLDSPDYYLRSSAEMAELFSGYEEALKNTLVIADQCNIQIPTGKLIFPRFELPENHTSESLLHEMTFTGAKKRLKTIDPSITKRLEYELEIINTKGYATYFLITQDFVNWAKEQGIGVGPGRGSAAGSLVSFSLGITSINPLIHGLAFERFLNPQRPTPPDIDLDFADDRRDEVIEYVAQKYGRDKVAHVITFGRMEARVAVRDIGRVLGLPYEEPDKIAKLIPNHPTKRTSLKQAIETVPELKAYYQQPKFRRLLDLAQKVEGRVRHSSVHAAAIVITDLPMSEYTAIQRDSKSGKILTQYDMYALDCNISDDAIGLLKFDFLGLRNISIIQTALYLIKRYQQVTIELDKLPLDDVDTFKLLSRGDTMGVFQLESAGMRRVARSLKPSQFSDITAMVALFRPGPMDLIPQFIEGKHNPAKVSYPHDSLKVILEETYGVMVYQEQILEIAHVMAGYSLGEADILRRAIGKKKKSLLDKNRKRFIEQAVEKKYTKAVAEKVWGFIEAFANYGFNKAHAASYAMIAYQTAYLKTHYPTEYMAALMSVESSSSSQNRDEKVAQTIEEAKNLGIKVLPPNINLSDKDFAIEKAKDSKEGWGIRFGLNAVKHVGEAALENIFAVRQKIGKFDSFTQFIFETDSRKVNKTTLECLIKVGAFDQFGSRASLLESLEPIRKRLAGIQKEDENQDTLFDHVTDQAVSMQDTLIEVDEYPKQELLSFEKELLGLYLTEHPMAKSLKAASGEATKQIAALDPKIHQGQIFKLGGVISNIRVVSTKKSGREMAFGILEDQTGKLNFVVFPRTYSQTRELLRLDAVVIMRGRLDYREEEVQLIVEKVTYPQADLGTFAATHNQHEIFIPRNTTQATLNQLGQLLKSNPGDESVLILIANGAEPEKMLLPYGVKWSVELADKIAVLLKN
ncbi:MAG TPA: DNA polymerase III subunit alpha [Candidatus Woesebacteria bacterium]|nr:DNA polymerase III subunit alpha [Candidatus Woesebacteria bacterium]